MSGPSTPYRALGERLPAWAVRRTVHRLDVRTLYAARPSELTQSDRDELTQLERLGWRVEITELAECVLVIISRQGGQQNGPLEIPSPRTTATALR